ncbi:MarR family winged helix-turn-helix transcriptional regulator [Rhodopseudomonas palustris]|nr:MarR family transcriptional regulator [Rhodopseudomonas palustris]
MLTMTDRRLKPLLKKCLALEGGGVTYGMWFFLRVLWEEDGLSQRELSERVGMMQPTAVTALRDMERHGFVKIKPDPNDGRSTRIFLTRAGRQVGDRMLPMVKGINDFVLKGISADEFDMLRNILRKMRANIDAGEFVPPRRRR